MLLRAGTLLNKTVGVGTFSPVFQADFSSGSFPASCTFARADSTTCATRFNSSGFLETLAAGVARFYYDPTTILFNGLLIEPSSTNSILYGSNLSSNWIVNTAGGDSLSVNSTVSPDGTLKGAIHTIGSSTAIHWLSAGASQTITASQAFSVSGFIKRIGSGANRYYGLSWRNSGSTIYGGAIVDLQLGTITPYTLGGGTVGSVSLISVPNGWFYFSINNIVIGSVTAVYCDYRGLGSTSFTATYSGDATSGFGLYGMQFETGLFSTSTILTSSSSVTRSSDTLGFTIPSGVTQILFTFDDGSEQIITGLSSGAYTVPTNLNRKCIKSIVGSA